MTGEFSPWGALALLLLAALALFHRPLGCLLRLAVRSSVGLAVLALFSSVGHYIGVNLGVNLVNALVLGVLGVPGFGLLLMLQRRLQKRRPFSVSMMYDSVNPESRLSERAPGGLWPSPPPPCAPARPGPGGPEWHSRWRG